MIFLSAIQAVRVQRVLERSYFTPGVRGFQRRDFLHHLSLLFSVVPPHAGHVLATTAALGSPWVVFLEEEVKQLRVGNDAGVVGYRHTFRVVSDGFVGWPFLRSTDIHAHDVKYTFHGTKSAIGTPKSSEAEGSLGLSRSHGRQLDRGAYVCHFLFFSQ